MSDDDEYYDLYGEDVKQTKPSNKIIALDNIIEENKVTTEQYLNDTIGDVISELLEECAQQSPPDPIVYLADLLEKKYRDIYDAPVKPQKSGRRKKTSSTVFKTAATIAHNVVNIKNTATAKSSKNPPEPEVEDQSKHSGVSSTKESPAKSAKSRPTDEDDRNGRHSKKGEGKPNGSSISHNVAVSNSKEPRKPASSKSEVSSSNVSRTSTSSKSSDNTGDSSTSQSRASNVKEKPRRRKKRTPTVALASDKYKERRGIVKPNSVESLDGKNGQGKDSFKDGFDLEKHLKETKKNYKHLVSKRSKIKEH